VRGDTILSNDRFAPEAVIAARSAFLTVYPN
jgi:hypothetical protein